MFRNTANNLVTLRAGTDDGAINFIAGGSAAERMRILANGNVGIGETSPDAKLHVMGTTGLPATSGTAFTGTMRLQVAGGYGTVMDFGAVGPSTGTQWIQVTDASNQALHYPLLLQPNGGYVGIGTTTPTGNLTVEASGNQLHLRASTATAGKFWNLDIASSNRLYIIDNGNTGVYINDGATSWTGVSDETLKENVKPLENVLDKIKDYRCVEYNLKSVPNDKKIGFIAQDWKEDYPQIVDKDDDGLLGMKYTETIPILLKAIQELKAEIELLKSK